MCPSVIGSQRASMHAHCRHSGAVVTITGDIDAANIDGVLHFASLFMPTGNAAALDLSRVGFFAAQSISLLIAVDDPDRTALCFSSRLKEEALNRGYASNIALSLVHEGEVIGTLCLYSGEKNVFGNEEVNFLEEVANDIAVGVKSLRMEKKVEEGYKETKKALEETIDTISLIGEFRDLYTAGHQRG